MCDRCLVQQGLERQTIVHARLAVTRQTKAQEAISRLGSGVMLPVLPGFEIAAPPDTIESRFLLDARALFESNLLGQ